MCMCRNWMHFSSVIYAPFHFYLEKPGKLMRLNINGIVLKMLQFWSHSRFSCRMCNNTIEPNKVNRFSNHVSHGFMRDYTDLSSLFFPICTAQTAYSLALDHSAAMCALNAKCFLERKTDKYSVRLFQLAIKIDDVTFLRFILLWTKLTKKGKQMSTIWSI